jgi:hypothetical protein
MLGHWNVEGLVSKTDIWTKIGDPTTTPPQQYPSFETPTQTLQRPVAQSLSKILYSEALNKWLSD